MTRLSENVTETKIKQRPKPEGIHNLVFLWFVTNTLHFEGIYFLFGRNREDLERERSDIRLVIEGTSSHISEMVSTSGSAVQGSQVTPEGFIGS